MTSRPTTRLTSSLMPRPSPSQSETHRTPMVISFTWSKAVTSKANSRSSADTTSFTCSRIALVSAGPESSCPRCPPRKQWATRISSSCRSAASTWSDFCANCPSTTSLSTVKSSRFSLAPKASTSRNLSRASSR